jgi:hypothetical protein
LTDDQTKYLESINEFDLGFPSNFIGGDPNVTGSSTFLDRTARTAFPSLRR